MPIDPLVTDLQNQPHVFVDDSLINTMAGLSRKVHPLTRQGAEPVLACTEPFEGALINPFGVVYDPARKLWFMWYGSFGKRTIHVAPESKITLHRAESDDGVTWRKPALGVCEAGGNTANNLCAWEDGSFVTGPCAVFDEPDEPDPSKRYKLITYHPSYYLSYSADGVTWRLAQKDPVWPNGAGDGLEETSGFFHDSISGKYRGYMRVWRRHQTIRYNGMGQSDDLTKWTGPEICFSAQPQGEVGFGPGSQVYGMIVHVDAGLYWGFPWILYTHEPLDDSIHETMPLKLAWSRDGIKWHIIAPETDILPMGQRPTQTSPDGKTSEGGFDWGIVMAQAAVVHHDGENWLYYCGMNGLHSHEEFPTIRAAGLARWRQGGLVSLATSSDTHHGQLVTRRFVMRGSEIRISARTAPGGSIRAELLNDGGSKIVAYSLAKSDAFTGDDTDHVLTWQGSGDLKTFTGQYLMLRLCLENAEIFSFRIHGSEEETRLSQGPAPITAGRCTHAPVIDGVLDDTCWQDFTRSAVATDFSAYEKVQRMEVQSRVMITYDDENLYLAVECEEPLSDRMATTREPGPIRYSEEDGVEVRLSAPHHGSYVHQFLMTATGKGDHNWFSKEAGGLQPDVPGKWTIKPHIVPGRWMLEVAIPFSTLTTETPKPGEQWKLNIIRYRCTDDGQERSSWSCTFGSVHRNDLAGTLFFK